jgi:hypothetical protein
MIVPGLSYQALAGWIAEQGSEVEAGVMEGATHR